MSPTRLPPQPLARPVWSLAGLALVCIAVIAFNAFFLLAALSEQYARVGVGKLGAEMVTLAMDVERSLNAAQRKTMAEIETLLESQRHRLGDRFHELFGARHASERAEPLSAWLDLGLALNSGDILVRTDSARTLDRLPDPLIAQGGADSDGVAVAPAGPVEELGHYYLAQDLFGRNQRKIGSLVAVVDGAALQAWVDPQLQRHRLRILALGACGLMIVVAFGAVLKRRPPKSQKSVYSTVLLALVLTQAAALLGAARDFQRDHLTTARDNAIEAAALIARLMQANPRVEAGSGVSASLLSRLVPGVAGQIYAITLADGNGRPLLSHNGPAAAPSPFHATVAAAAFGKLPPRSLWLSSTSGRAEADASERWSVVAHLSEPAIYRASMALTAKGLTMLVVALLLTVELMLLLALIGRREPGNVALNDRVSARLMRPAMFFFLFGIDLSMAFVPLHMQELYVPILDLPKDMVLGLPISVEFLFVGVFFLSSGFWVDRRGWHEPFMVGLILASLGVVYSWYAPDGVHFIASRAVVGAGYGLALMASQGSVVILGGPEGKASGLANLFAGLYAGSICGAVTGSVLAEQFGYRPVFFLGAIVIAAVVLYTLLLMRESMRVVPAGSGDASAAAAAGGLSRVLRFLANPTVLALIVLSSLPASIAVAGFIHFFTPTYLDQLGVSESSIGQILMIYGICQIFIGPRLGRIMDATHSKKLFVSIGNLLGSASFLLFYFSHNVLGVGLAVLLLGISSSFVLASQSTMLLNLPVSQQLGHGKAIGIFRSSSRIGQVIGPMIFGAVLLSSDIGTAITYLGVAYFVAVVLFMVFAREQEGPLVPDAARLETRSS